MSYGQPGGGFYGGGGGGGGANISGPVTVQIQRAHSSQPWGFRLQGGRDFRQQLAVKKVTPGSPAEGQLHPGDAITAIGGYDTSNLTHSQASQMIQQSGSALQMTLHKGQYRSIKPKGPVKFSPGTAHTYGY